MIIGVGNMKLTVDLTKCGLFAGGIWLVEAQLIWLCQNGYRTSETDLLFGASGKCGNILKVHEIGDGFMFYFILYKV